MNKLGLLAGAAILSAATLSAESVKAQAPPGGGQPNIVFILMDNLGYDEVGVYGGGITRGAPTPRIDRIEFLLGRSDASKRKGFSVFVADLLEAVKWRNWKPVFYDEQRDWWTPPLRLGSPKSFDLIADPKEEYPATAMRNIRHAEPALRIATEFERSLKRYPSVAPGVPDPYTPPN